MKTAGQIADEHMLAFTSAEDGRQITLELLDHDVQEQSALFISEQLESAVRSDRAQRVARRGKSADYDADGYPYVSEREQSVATRWEHMLTNTGGNSARELLNDLGDPNSNMLRTNIVRFTLAVAVEAQVSLLSRLENEGLI